MTHFVVERGEMGLRAVLTGPWSSRVGDYIRAECIPELYLNHGRGWRGDDLNFLSEVPNLTGFGIIDLTINDVSPIHQLRRLRSLEISTYCATPINFSRFSSLEQCTFYWRAGSESLFGCTNLKQLFIHRYSESVSDQLATLASLQSLSIANSDVGELTAVARLLKLRKLGLYNLRKLRGLTGIESLLQLEELTIQGCKNIGTIDEIAFLKQLRRLLLNNDGRIASLRPLADLHRLEDVLFYESTNIEDGDLSALTTLPRLRNVSFQNRRHYSHRREEFAQESGGNS